MPAATPTHDATLVSTPAAPDTPAAAPEYVTTETVAGILSCHVRTVWRLAERGLLPPPVVLCGTRRWNLRRVLAAVQAAEVPLAGRRRGRAAAE